MLEANVWKVVTLSYVQINLCLLAFTFNYSAEHVLNHSTTEGCMLEDRMCCGWVLLDCTELRLQGSTYWTLLKGMLSSVWFCSIPGSLFSTPPTLSAFSRQSATYNCLSANENLDGKTTQMWLQKLQYKPPNPFDLKGCEQWWHICGGCLSIWQRPPEVTDSIIKISCSVCSIPTVLQFISIFFIGNYIFLLFNSCYLMRGFWNYYSSVIY